jgi:Asp-tRNA(Asn)/Glu-tRNA(Gln) amidotransferase A subunit family amidase
MTNPLIEKYNEIHNPKPSELPKPVEKPKSVKLKSYDLDDLKASFQQVAEKLQNDKAQVVSMNMEMGHKYINTTGARITFEVSLDDY